MSKQSGIKSPQSHYEPLGIKAIISMTDQAFQ